jgi:hypothetical protein
MMSELKPPRPKYEHVYAIVRWATDAPDDSPLDFRITVKKVVTDPGYAEREVQRLNGLNSDKGSYYFFQLTRFEAEAPQTVPVPELSADIVRPGDSRKN